MQRTPTSHSRLTLEPLEDRHNPTTGVPWLDSTSLTVSFAPDGTDASGSASSAFALLGAMPTATWQREVLRAYQTWAAAANINVGLVADGGQPFGTPGAPQEDNRFGDFRFGARPLSFATADSLAGSVGFSHAGGTWSGDVLLNTQFKFGIGATATQNDLYTVALQEAGNSLSLLDNPADVTSVMYPKYQNRAVTGLAASDVSAIQALYGARKEDAYEGAGHDDTIATAFDMTANGNITALTGDVTRVGDADVYKFTTPSLTSGVTGLTINLNAAGLSLLTGKVTVYNALNVVVGTASTSDPRNNNLSVPVVGYLPNATYYVKVEGAGTDVFSTGAYNLKLAYNKLLGVSKISTLSPYINAEGWVNDTLSAAKSLLPLSTGNLSTFAVGGMLTSATDVDWFKFTPAASTGGVLTVSVWAYSGSSVLPTVKVYDATGTQLPVDVIANQSGLFTVQVQNRAAGGSYFAQVSAANPAGGNATGLYVMGANLGVHLPTLYEALSSGTLSASQATSYADMTVGEARLTQFSLSAASVGVDAAVRMSIYDAAGHRVFTLVAYAGQTLTTGAVWLASGNYTVVYNASTRTGAPLPTLAFVVNKWERSSPIDPYQTDDPTSPPPPPPPPPGNQVSSGPPRSTPPPTAPVDPIPDPYANT